MIFHRSNFLSPRICSMAAVLAALSLVTTQRATAAIIVNDTWQDGTDTDPASPIHSEFGVDSDADNNLESVWYQGGVGTLDPVAAGGPQRGNMTAGGTSSASWTTYFTPETSPITLAATGDFVKVTWAFTLTNVNAANTSQNFRFAMVDSPAPRLAANGAPASGAFTGYSMFTNMAQTLGNSNPFRLMRRNVASGDLMSTGGNWQAIGTTGAASGNHGYDAATPYTLTWTVTRNAASGLDHDVVMTGGTLDADGTAQVTFTDATPGALGGFVFDTFAIRPSGATTTAELFDTTLFKVETNTVPEPASLALVGLVSLAMAMVRRRGQ